MDYKSVDLTEDEDSRETISDVIENVHVPYISYAQVSGNIPRMNTLSPSTPPPLTPICEINSLRNQRSLNNQHRSVPKLKRIHKSTTHASHTTLSDPVVANPTESVIINPTVEYQIENRFLALQNSSPLKSQLGKEWTIKKGGKTFKIVIPHNVLPSLNDSNGSVVVNVPEVGPIMLKINPHFKDCSAPELEPFSLNFDTLMESASEPLPQINTTQSATHVISVAASRPSYILPVNNSELLFDSRFCWIQPRYKNYFYSFRCNFNGFSKTDMQKARRCARILNLGIKRLDNIFSGKKLDSKRSSKSNKSVPSYKFVNSAYSPVNNNFQMSSVLPLNNSDNFINSWELDMDIGDVLTPKVVIETEEIDNSNLHGSLSGTVRAAAKIDNLISYSQLKKSFESLPVTIEKHGIKVYIKPCFVKIFRDYDIDNHVKLIHNTISLKKTANKKTLSSKGRIKMFISKLINTEAKFVDQMTYIKPILIVNEFNFGIVQFRSEFSKSNIVLAVQKKKFSKKILENENFVQAVSEGLVKLVDCDLLTKYIRGEVGPFNLDIT